MASVAWAAESDGRKLGVVDGAVVLAVVAYLVQVIRDQIRQRDPTQGLQASTLIDHMRREEAMLDKLCVSINNQSVVTREEIVHRQAMSTALENIVRALESHTLLLDRLLREGEK